MRVDPTDPATVKIVCPDKDNYLFVGHVCNLMHQSIGLQQLAAAAGISDQQLTVNQIVTGRFFAIQVSTKTIYADLGSAGASRRLGTSFAIFSVPRNFRSLS